MNHILSFALALAIATALLPLCARYAALFGLLDADTQERKIHKGIVPRSGGIGIVAGAIIAFLVWVPAVDVPVPLLCAIAVIAIFGLLDDRFDLRPIWQLAAQGTAAMIVIASYGGFQFLPWMGIQEVSAWVCVPITFVFIVGITNAVNLSDGLDGLAAGNSLLSFIVLAGLAYKADLEALSIFSMAIAGGLMGFLRFNTHPAKIFMGDTGSQFLGFAAAALCVLIFQSENLAISPALPLLIFALPVLDTLSVMAVRLVRGRPIFAADRSHLHHQLMRIGFRHYEVVVLLYGLQAIAVIIAWLLRYESDTIVFMSYCLYCAAILGSILTARLLEWQPRPPNRGRGTKRERRNLFLRRYQWLHQNAHKSVVLVIAAFFLAVAITTPAAARVGEAGLLTAGGLLVLWTLLRNHDEWVSRLIVFAASAVLVYGSLIDPELRVAYNWMIDGYLALVVLTLCIAVRVTRKDIFRLDSQDYLVLVIIGFVPVLMINQFDPGLVVRVSLRLAVILYAAEFVMTSTKPSSKQALNAVALISIGLASV